MAAQAARIGCCYLIQFIPGVNHGVYAAAILAEARSVGIAVYADLVVGETLNHGPRIRDARQRGHLLGAVKRRRSLNT